MNSSHEDYAEVMASMGLGQTAQPPLVSETGAAPGDEVLAPEDLLEAATARLCGMETDDQREQSRRFVENYRRKQEQYLAHLSLCRSARLAEIFRAFWQQVVPEVYREDRLSAMTNGQIITLLRSTHEIIAKESDAQLAVLKNGPHDIEDSARARRDDIKAVGLSEESQMGKAVGNFASLPPEGRERVRVLFDSLIKFGKKVGQDSSES